MESKDVSYGDAIGLVLSGGGAKGAYQAGVWKAMVETGIADRVQVISGTSVGAINAAAFSAIRDPARIESLWRNGVSAIVTPNFKALSPLKMLEVIENFMDGKPFSVHGLLDKDALESFLTNALKATKQAVGNPVVYATSLECRGEAFGEFDRTSYRKTCFRIDDELSLDLKIAKILASCAIPLCFSPVEIAGRRYVDGGWDAMGGENVPITPLLRKHTDLSTIVVVRCNSKSIEPEPLKIPSKAANKIIEIRPKEPLPGIFDIGNIGGGLLAGALIPGIGVGGTLSLILSALGGLFASNRAKVWGATLAFSSDYTDQFFSRGYEDGIGTFWGALSW